MQIYSDKFGRVIYLSVSPSEIRLDLQDLSPDFEYERCATVTAVEQVCKAFNCEVKDLVASLLSLLQNQMTAFDLFTEFLENHQIHYEYFSG